MSILYDEAQEAIAVEAKRVLETRYDQNCLLSLLETQNAYDESFWNTCQEQGWTGVTVSEAYGGLDLSLVEMGIIAEACGRFTVGAPFLSSGFAVSAALSDFGSESVKEAWLPKIAAGEAIGCLGVSETGATIPSNSGLQVTGSRVSGFKPAVPAGGHAHIMVAITQEAGEPSLGVIDLSQAGVTRTAINTFDNSRCAADFTFSDVQIETLLKGDAAIKAARNILAKLAVITAHEQTGGAQALLDATRDYALERKAFGQVIGAFQSVKHRIAEMYALVELARANALHAASLEGQAGFEAAAGAARLSATDAYDTAARDAIQVHGGIGVTWEGGLHLHQRRARSLAIEGGPSSFWEDCLVDRILEGAA